MKSSMISDKKEVPITASEFNEKFLKNNASGIVIKNNRYCIEDKGKINDSDTNSMNNSKHSGSIEYSNKLKTPSDTTNYDDIYASYLSSAGQSMKKDKNGNILNDLISLI